VVHGFAVARPRHAPGVDTLPARAAEENAVHPYYPIGFAVPADTINRVVPRLIGYGRYVRPTLGISANDDVSRQLLGEDAPKGVLVLGVTPGSPAAQAGLRATEVTRAGRASIGDVIEAVDGKPVASFSALINVLDTHDFGDRITLTVRRGNGRIEVPVTLTGSR
jgi:S1-C subfamily serine protease